MAIVLAASHGTTSIDPASGVITYSPALNYTGPDSFTYTVKDNSGANSNQATVSINVTGPLIGLLLLDPTGKGALTDAGNGSVVVNNGSIVVDSSSSQAAIITGNGNVTAAIIDVTGGTRTTGHGQFFGSIVHAAATPDPLGLPLPPAPSTRRAAVDYSGSAPLTLNPGTYVGGIRISGQGSVTLNPGIYYMQGGGFSVTGKGSVTGNGVLIVNACGRSDDKDDEDDGHHDQESHGGADKEVSTGNISFSGQGTITLTAPATLPNAYNQYAGIAIFQDPASNSAINFSGRGGLTIQGVVYAPKATLNISGQGNMVVNPGPASNLPAEVIVYDAHVTGNGGLTINNIQPLFSVSGASGADAQNQPDTSALQTNPPNPFDVNGDGFVSPLDALLIINDLIAHGTRPLGATGDGAPLLDVNGDAYLSPLDALVEINYLNGHPNSGGADVVSQPVVSATTFVTNNNTATLDGIPSALPLPATSSGIGANGVSSVLPATIAGSGSSMPNVPDWLTNLPPNVDLNSGPRATYFRQLAEENTPADRAVLVEADRIADELGLDDELLDSLLAGLGLE